MARKYSYSHDENSDIAVKKYEDFLSGSSSAGYFDVEEFEDIVEHYLRKGNTNDSSKALEMALKQHPASSELQTKRAKICLVSGNPQQALRILETVTEKDDYDVLLLKMDVLLHLERENEALKIAERFVSTIESKYLDFAYLDVAYVYIHHRKYETAIELLKKGDESNPNNIDLLFELAFCYERTDEFDKAIETHQRILTIDTFVSEAWFNLAQLYFSQEKYEQALQSYDYVLAIDPSDAFSCLQKAHVLLSAERYREAVECFAEYGELVPDDELTYNCIGECYECLENYDTAISYYEKTLISDANNYEALVGVAICLLEQEKYEESIHYTQRAINAQPDYAETWIYLAEAYVGLENFDEALYAYQKSLLLEPNQPETLIAIGNLQLDKEDYLSALYYYNSAHEQDQNIEYINLFFAVAYFKLENFEVSLSYLLDAVEANDDALSLFLEICPEANKLINPENTPNP